MNRIVLVSDPTKEFPTNTTSSFKVRLPVTGGYRVGASTWTSWRWKSPRVTDA